MDTSFVLFTSESPNGRPVEVEVSRSAAGTELSTDVTMQWDGVWDTLAVRGGLEAYILTNDAGITFLRWMEQDHFVQFEARMPAEESLTFAESQIVSQG